MAYCVAAFALSILPLFPCPGFDAEEVERPDVVTSWCDQKIVVLIVGVPDEPQNTEMHGDWAHYVNTFASSVGEEYTFYRVSAEEQLFSLNGHDEPYSTIFLRRGDPDFFYEGPILEPHVYEVVRRYYAGEEMPEYFLQFKPEEVEVQLDSEKRRFEVREHESP